MVLYKRKPIILPDPKPLPSDLDVSVWYINETGEWFLTYEEYLDRMDFYTRHHFTCEITGASCLTFFEALNSEDSQFKYVEDKFPLKLREPVARYLHFNKIKRLDALIENVYSKFKSNFFPGEIVYLRKPKDIINEDTSKQNTPTPSSSILSENSPNSSNTTTNHQKTYIIKEKVQFNPIIDPVTKEVITPGHARYMLVENDDSSISNSNKYFVADESQIYRDRSTFTKHLIKCFSKITLQRASSKMGAPWCVKPEYLQMYGLTMDWPVDLLQYKDDEPNKKVADNITVSSSAKSPKTKKSSKSKESQLEQTNDIDTDNNNSEGSSNIIINDKDQSDSDTPKKQRNSKKRKNKSNNETTSTNTSSSNTDSDTNSNKQNKKRKVNDNKSDQINGNDNDSRASSIVPETSTPVVIRSIVTDMDIPYRGRPKLYLSNLSSYNSYLECIPLMNNKNLNKPTLTNFDQLLQIYQFISTFNKVLCISYFNFDQLVASLKATDPFELQGEFVDVSLKNTKINDTSTDINNGTELSQWQRNPKIRQFIEEKNVLNNDLNYSILRDEPVTDDIIDNFNSNGSALIIEIFVALLRLFIDENGDWKIVILENWINNPISMDEQELGITPKGIHDSNGGPQSELNNIENINNQNNEREDGKNLEDVTIADNETNIKEEDNNYESSYTDEEFSNIMEKVLTFRNQDWTERLIKRQFNNGNWLIILLGIFEDSLVIPKYTKFLTYFRKTIITSNISMTQLPKVLWRNFCRNFSLADKITTLWVLVDIVSNFSPDIKNAIEASMELCMHIRSDRFKIFKDIKAETTALASINKEESLEEYEAKETHIQELQDEKSKLDKKLMENDYQRLKPLGMDRYCNRYFWFDLTGIPNKPFSKDETEYHSGRLWIRGPNKYCIRNFLKLDDEQVTKWLKICKIEGSSIATKNVFGVYRTEAGAYIYHDPTSKEDIELMSQDGQINKSISLTPIQRKIIDETPECLLLDRSQWYCIESIEYIDSFVEWLDIWGRREHDLLRQLKPILSRIKDVVSIRNNCFNSELSKKELQYIEELEDYQLSSNEIDLDNTDNKDSLVEEDNEIDDIDNKLEHIVEEIMNLDDGSKTRKVLNALSDLESKRDFLLAKKKKLLSEGNTSGRVVARSEQQKIKKSRDNKLARQQEILSALINMRHFKELDSVLSWKNEAAIEMYGSELRKNANKGKRGSSRRK